MHASQMYSCTQSIGRRFYNTPEKYLTNIDIFMWEKFVNLNSCPVFSYFPQPLITVIGFVCVSFIQYMKGIFNLEHETYSFFLIKCTTFLLKKYIFTTCWLMFKETYYMKLKSLYFSVSNYRGQLWYSTYCR